MWAFGSLGAYNSRHYIVPPAQGIDVRILNGWMYCTPIPVWDPEDIPARVPHFMERAGFYFGNWNELYAKWMDKARGVISRLEAISFDTTARHGSARSGDARPRQSNIYDLSRSTTICSTSALELWQYHFEFLNLGYAAYLDYFMFCKQVFPNIPDLSIAKMVAGIDVDLFRPDQELRKLARSAVDEGPRRACSRRALGRGARGRW